MRNPGKAQGKRKKTLDQEPQAQPEAEAVLDTPRLRGIDRRDDDLEVLEIAEEDHRIPDLEPRPKTVREPDKEPRSQLESRFCPFGGGRGRY